ncbi:MAG: cobalamin biosynthesis protein CbiD [Lachnospiraceae bacterium]|nr:cobalamin biosynthesis protein CbiD [Candidatus Equihabitans merdae]
MSAIREALRWGYTTGSCAAGAAKAAASMLVSGEMVDHIRLLTPKGYDLTLEVHDISTGNQEVSCAIRKDSGDDPDVTNGSLVYASVKRISEPGVQITGGIGVGVVTKPGLDQPVGNHAINSTPRRMIREAVEEVTANDHHQGGYLVTISIPDGVELAKKTFNPKLGIEGGISVLGTTGIVEPMSDEALKATIEVELNVKAAEKSDIVVMAPGNYGKAFMEQTYGFSLETAVTTSNFIAESMKMAADRGFTKALFVGHCGKLVKVAGGIENTHSKYGDHRMEILTDIACPMLDEDQAASLKAELAECIATDDAVAILDRYGIRQKAMDEMVLRIRHYLQLFSGEKIHVEVVTFSNVYGELGKTAQADAWLDLLTDREV